MWKLGTLVAALALNAAPSIHSEPLAFAFGDADGRRLLAFEGAERPRSLKVAVCEDGRTRDIEYRGPQPARADDTGRQTDRNFAAHAGEIYEVRSRPVPGGGTCVLLAKAPSSVRRAEGPGRMCDASTLAGLSKRSGRSVTVCVQWNLGVGRSAGLAELSPDGDRLLAVLFLVENTGGLRLHEITGKRSSEKLSCWRADDDCTLSPADFRLLALETTASTRLLVLWGGPEGQSIKLLEPLQSELRPVGESYRYWAPR